MLFARLKNLPAGPQAFSGGKGPLCIISSASQVSISFLTILKNLESTAALRCYKSGIREATWCCNTWAGSNSHSLLIPGFIVEGCLFCESCGTEDTGGRRRGHFQDSDLASVLAAVSEEDGVVFKGRNYCKIITQQSSLALAKVITCVYCFLLRQNTFQKSSCATVPQQRTQLISPLIGS